MKEHEDPSRIERAMFEHFADQDYRPVQPSKAERERMKRGDAMLSAALQAAVLMLMAVVLATTALKRDNPMELAMGLFTSFVMFFIAGLSLQEHGGDR